MALAAGSRLVVRTGMGCGDSNGGPSTVLMDVDVGDTLQALFTKWFVDTGVPIYLAWAVYADC